MSDFGSHVGEYSHYGLVNCDNHVLWQVVTKVSEGHYLLP
jgi:hypothetical protein